MNHLPAAACLICLLAAALPGKTQADPLDRLVRYIETDTVNPPGNESRGVTFFSKIFDAAGIAYETAESAPGRGNIWARIKGGNEPGLILLHHIDVVPATAAAWETDPLRAITKDGKLHGRGALDTKALGIAHLEAFLTLHASQAALSRDVIFMATADEEAGGLMGAGWLLKNRPESIAGAGYLLNEGGAGIDTGNKTRFQIEVAQKRPYWLRLTASDTPGHGSSPHLTSAPGRLIAALNRIQQSPFEPRIIAPVRDMFSGIADYSEPEWQSALRNIDFAIQDGDFMARFQAGKARLHALLRNTCSITMLSGSNKINVVPATASAELDCRLLPDQDAEQFKAGILARVDDEQIQIEEIMSFGASASSSDTPLFRLLKTVSQLHYPTAGVLASVSGGFTDSHFFREHDIVSYGYAPFMIPAADLAGVHGNNERIGIENFKHGVEVITEIVRSFAAGSIQ